MNHKPISVAYDVAASDVSDGALYEEAVEWLGTNSFENVLRYEQTIQRAEAADYKQ